MISQGRLVAQGIARRPHQRRPGADLGAHARARAAPAALAAKPDVDVQDGDAGPGWLAVRGGFARGRRDHGRGGRRAGVRALPATPVARERLPRAHLRHRGRRMTHLLGSELLKLRTTRTFWALAGSTFALILLIVILSLILDDALKSDEDAALSLLTTGSLAGLLMLVLGAVVGAGEYRHGTIASTLLVTPNRLRAVGAQTLACGVGGLVVGFLGVALVAVVALPWLSAHRRRGAGLRRHRPDRAREHALRGARRCARRRDRRGAAQPGRGDRDPAAVPLRGGPGDLGARRGLRALLADRPRHRDERRARRRRGLRPASAWGWRRSSGPATPRRWWGSPPSSPRSATSRRV